MIPKIVNFDLKKLSQELRETYKDAQPYPHIYIDNFFDENFLNNVLVEFPDLSTTPEIINGDNGVTDIKLMTKRGDSQLSPLGRLFVWYLNSHEFIDFLQGLTGIKESLIPDPHLIGGGMHEIKPGGFLKVHSDYMFHYETKLSRRLNVIIYMNKNWKQEYGGDLELWDSKMSRREKSIQPLFNRIAIFDTTSFTYHGLPDPLTCPDRMSRKSFALYYYSNGRPLNEIKSVESHTTEFVNRPNEKMQFRRDASYWIHQFTPPIIIEKLRSIRDAFGFPPKN